MDELLDLARLPTSHPVGETFPRDVIGGTTEINSQQIDYLFAIAETQDIRGLAPRRIKEWKTLLDFSGSQAIHWNSAHRCIAQRSVFGRQRLRSQRQRSRFMQAQCCDPPLSSACLLWDAALCCRVLANLVSICRNWM